MSGLPRHRDAYGRAMLDHFEGRLQDPVILERDDGLVTTDVGIETYFTDHSKWDACTRQALRLVRGRVLDVGAGAGRVALRLQDRGRDVVAIDNSPSAVEVCRRRGIRDARVVPFTRVTPKLGTFDTIVLVGNNFGLFGSPERARWLLRRLKRMTSPDARIVGQTLDPHVTDDPDHRAYHRLNRRRGRMAGQLRLRVRYKRMSTPWFDYLFVSPAELRRIVAGTGWRVTRIIDCRHRAMRIYFAVIEKADA